ncbi:MAG: SCO family protein, partial [Nitrolancea sp.]
MRTSSFSRPSARRSGGSIAAGAKQSRLFGHPNPGAVTKWTNLAMRRFRFLSLLPLTLCLILLTSACGNSSNKLTGTSLDKTPAPDFTLTDQRGQTVTLSSLRGHAVALTFIYTNCTDICPLIAEKLHSAYEMLSPSQQQDVV